MNRRHLLKLLFAAPLARFFNPKPSGKTIVIHRDDLCLRWMEYERGWVSMQDLDSKCANNWMMRRDARRREVQYILTNSEKSAVNTAESVTGA